MEQQAFWRMLERLIATSQVVIDRPRNSPHPTWTDIVYPLDYGYLAGTSSADGAGIDIWIGSGDVNQVTGVVCTVDNLKRDSEMKVLLGCTPAEMEIVRQFHTGETTACYLIPRQTAP